MSLDVGSTRDKEFPWMNAGDIVYMNAASTGPLPQRSVDAQVDFTRRRAAPHLVDYDAQFGTLSRCRDLIGEMLHASPEEIALAPNTGAGVNLAAWGLPLGPGDEVIVSDAEFPANMYPWLAASAARGFTVHRVPLRDGVIDDDAMIEALQRPAVRALAVSWVGFSSGVVADIHRMSAACRARGAFFIVDAIQGLGPLTLDVLTTPIDILACGGQKWLLAPWGSGFTYVRREVIDVITPQPVSWMAVRGADDFSKLIDYDLTWRAGARRFEQVTLAYQDFAGLAASVEFLRDFGFERVSDACTANARKLRDGAMALGIPLLASERQQAGIASLKPNDAARVSEHLTSSGIIHSLRESTIRLAPHCYTTDEDVDRVLAILSS